MRIIRSGFLKVAAYTAGGIEIQPLLAAADEEGKLRLIPAPPNPAGAFDRLFLLTGDPAAESIREIVPAAGAKTPAASLSPCESRRLILYHFNDFHSHQVVMKSQKINRMAKQKVAIKLYSIRKRGIPITWLRWFKKSAPPGKAPKKTR